MIKLFSIRMKAKPLYSETNAKECVAYEINPHGRRPPSVSRLGSLLLGRHFVGIELNETYFNDLLAPRIQNAQRQVRMFV